MPRYAVSHINWFDHELTTDIVEAIDTFEAIKKSKKACELVVHVLDDETHVFHKTVGLSKQLDILKQAAFNGDGMIHVEPIPDIAPIPTDDNRIPKNILL